MADKNRPPKEPEEDQFKVTTNQKRWFWIRTVLITVLMFIFVMWYAYPTRGNIAILWSAGLSAAILAYFVFSYYKLYR